MCVSKNGPLESWVNNFATDRPTVPNPISPTFHFFPAGAIFTEGDPFFCAGFTPPDRLID